MSEFVQAYDPDHGVYRLIRVSTGDFLEEKPVPFPRVDEVDALESRKQRQPVRYDPLGDYR